MAKMTASTQRIDEVLIAQAGDPFYLEHLVPPSDPAARCDDSFLILDVAVPVQDHQPDEMLLVWAGDSIGFAFPVELLVTAYRTWSMHQAPEELAELHKCIGTMARDVAATWARARTGPAAGDMAQLVMSTEVLTGLTSLMTSFTKATADMMGGAGHKLGRAILVAPRMSIRVQTSHGSPLKVYLRGLRGIRLS